MGRKVIHENHRVEVEPNTFWVTAKEGTEKWHAELQSRCGDIAASIRRHVDEVSNVTVQWDRKGVCEFCGRAWTEGKDDSHNGGCCDNDAANMPEESEASA